MRETLYPVVQNERLFVFVLSMTHGLQHFFAKVFPPLIPLLGLELGLPLWKLGLLVTLQSLSGGLGQAPLGVLADRYDRRFLLPTGLIVVGAGYALVAGSTMLGVQIPTMQLLSYDIEGVFLVLAAGMFLAGFGKSATHPTGYPLITANVAQGKKGKVLGRWSGAAKLGDAAGPAAVGVLILALTWQQVFMVIAGIAGVYGVFLFAFMTRSKLVTVPPKEDAPEAQVDESGNGTYRYAMLAVFLFSIFAMLATRGIGTYMPEFVTSVYGFSITLFNVTVGPESMASFYYAIMLLAAAVATFIIGDLCDDHDPRTILFGLFATATAAILIVSLVPLTPVTLLVASILLGVTLFSFSPARDAIITNVTPAAREGRTFGYFWTALLITTSIYPVFIGYLGDTIGIQQSFTFLAGGSFLAAIAVLLLYRRKM